jgi:A/G-specific adenine glycosylase
MARPGLPRLRRALLEWFAAHRRDLPWRRTRDPYAIWVSEIMLQQTQVATVIPYYTRFLQRLPTAAALARAPITEVLALWSGLGYYSRARNLHRAAQCVARDGMPRTAPGLRALPGFGPYTAAAVASIAFGEPVAALDGNVARVLARLGAHRAALGTVSTSRLLQAEADELLDRERPGPFNEAMMELGALVCTPEDPLCSRCPLKPGCRASRLGSQHRIPAPRARPARPRLEVACAVVRSGDRLLLARRPEKGLFGGLWELPCAPLRNGGSGPEALARLGLQTLSGRPLASLRRILTHRELHLSLFACRARRLRLPGYLERRSVPMAHISQLGISKAMIQAISKIL